MRKILLTFVAVLFAAPVFAQERAQDNVADSLLTKEQATTRIGEWTTKVNGLQSKFSGLDNEVNTMNSQLAQVKADADRCNQSIYAMVGATEADVQNFRERLGRIEGRIRDMKNMTDEQLSKQIADIDLLESDLNGLRREKISVLPEFYNRVLTAAQDIRTLRERAGRGKTTYTVGTWAKDRDCLWNISAKDQIYGDPFMWPKIWQANTDQIRNPDVIQPGQELQIPPRGPKTDDEMRAERLYFRNKRVAAARARRVASERAQQVEQKEPESGNK